MGVTLNCRRFKTDSFMFACFFVRVSSASKEKDEIPKTQPTTVDPNMRTLPTGTGVSQRNLALLFKSFR